jgi:adenosylmethionine-8-amino-7-oxononanoate aminotransferase
MTNQFATSATEDLSRKYFERALRVTPGGVHSPVRAFKGVGGTPVFFRSAHGGTLTCVEGLEYIDFCQSFGPLILGHAAPVVLDALTAVMKNGTSFGASTPAEADLGELVISAFPQMQKVRFVSSGTEATMSAIRLARAGRRHQAAPELPHGLFPDVRTMKQPGHGNGSWNGSIFACRWNEAFGELSVREFALVFFEQRAAIEQGTGFSELLHVERLRP